VKITKAHELHSDQMTVDILHSDLMAIVAPPPELLSSPELEDLFIFKGSKPLILLMILTIGSL
jgi:hypothetical protein